MSGLLVLVGLILIAMVVAHSGLGEIFILHRMERLPRLPPTLGGEDGGRRALRAAWHSLSVLGLAYTLILIYYASLARPGADERFVIRVMAISLLLSSVVWCVGTRGKHLAWVGFLVTGVLCWVAAG